MGKIITPISLTKVPKLEFPDLVNGVADIVREYNPATMHIEDQYNLLLEVKPQLSSLVVVNKKNPETKILVGLRAKRKDVLLGLVRQTKSLAKPKLALQAPDLDLVIPFVNTYWADLISYNEKTISECLKQMFSAIEADADLRAAFTALGLNVLIDELKTLQASIVASINKQRKSTSEVPKMRTREVKSEVSEALTDLLKAIELAGKAHPELGYKPMVNEINVVLTSYQSDLKARATRNKNTTTTIAMSPTTTATAV
jgi:hypothetical protein